MTYKRLSNRKLNKSKHFLLVYVLPFIEPNLFLDLLSFDDVSVAAYYNVSHSNLPWSKITITQILNPLNIHTGPLVKFCKI
jgi:hypothetical protein